MSTYDDLWHREVAPEMRTRLLLSQLLYRAPNDRYDTFLRDLRRIGPEALSAANAGRLRDILRLLHVRDVPLLASVLGEHLSEVPLLPD